MKNILISALILCISSPVLAQMKPVKPTTTEPNLIKVFKSDSGTQCDKNGIPLDKMQLELENVGIDIKCAQKLSDGMMRPMVCGAPAGKLNIYTIAKEKLADAKALGFQPIGTLKHYRDEPCR